VTACSDGSACTVDLCDPVLGCTSTPISCDDNDACTTDSCDDVAGCQHEAVACNDGDLCTTDACDSATGCTYKPKNCDDGNLCTADGCDSQTGTCEHEARINEPCNDNDTCTDNDRCDAAGACLGYAVNPDDDNPCTIDACDGLVGITHEPVGVGGWCTDGDPSNGTEVCNTSGACVGLPLSESVVDRVGGQDPDVRERQLGVGRHPVAASEDGLAVAFYEVLKSGGARVAVATFSSLGEGRGLWRADASVLDLDPVVVGVPGGGFVVAYQDLLADGDGLDVALVRLNADGQQLSSVQVANDKILYGQHSPDLVWQGDRLWVAWEDDSALVSEGGRRICVRAFTGGLVPEGVEACDSAMGQNRGAVAWAATDDGPARAWRNEAAGAGSIELSWAGAIHPFPLDVLPPAAEMPAVTAIDATHVLLVYTDGYGDQKAAVVGDGGAVTGPWLINPAPEAARFEPSLAVTDDGVYLAWREPADDTQGWTANLDDTYFQKLTWDGVSLMAAEAPWPLPHNSVYMVGDQRRSALLGVGVTASGALWSAWDDLREEQAGPEHGDVRVSLMPTPVVRPGLAM